MSGSSWWSDSGMAGAPPLHATRRDDSRLTEGGQVGVIADALGTPLLPWQRYVADVAGERRPDGSYEYQVVVVSVPRQSGKTTLIRAVGMWRAMSGRDAFYTAQTGKDARARFNDLVKQIRKSVFQPPRTTIRRSQGSEAVAFPSGVFQLFAPTSESLHGYTPPTVFLDEAFAHSEEEGDILLGAISPAQQTVLDRQLWIVSTAGTAESGFLRKWLDKAVAGEPRVACFVWAAADDLDPFAAESVEAFHPAIGFRLGNKTMTAQDILEEINRNSRAEYERAFFNRWTVTTAHRVPREVWRDLELQNVPPPADNRNVVLTYDVAHDQMSSSVLATWHHAGKPFSKVVKAGPGVTWLVEYVDQLAGAWRCTVAADDNGPARDVTEQLRRRGLQIATTDSRAWATATARFFNLVNTAGLAYADVDDVLADAVAGLTTRLTNDGEAVSRKHSSGDISAAAALIVGVWFVDHLEVATSSPQLYFGGAA